jgi:hypothetical protein
VLEAVGAVPLEIQATWALLEATETRAAKTRTVSAVIFHRIWNRM